MTNEKVLIIEDAPELADSLEDMLEIKGFKTLKTNSGREGIEYALTEKPDLILLDLRLPDIHGFEVLRRLRKDPWGVTAKVLVITASESPDLIMSENLGLSSDKILQKEKWNILDLADRVEAEIKSKKPI